MVGREGGLEKVLPEEVGGRGDQGEEEELEGGDVRYCEGLLGGGLILGLWFRW